MSDFLLELLCEEIPARMQDKASADLARLFAEETAKAGLAIQAEQVWATPRRLALIARGLPAATAAVAEETKGPKTSAPDQAIDGFLRKTGLTRDQLVEPRFTHIQQDEQEIGCRAVDLLLAQIEGRPSPSQSIVPHRLVDGRSRREVVQREGIAILTPEATLLVLPDLRPSEGLHPHSCQAGQLVTSPLPRQHRPPPR